MFERLGFDAAMVPFHAGAAGAQLGEESAEPA
jgi:hypothetical protein